MKITRRRLIAGTVAAGAATALLPSTAAVAFISPPLVLLARAQSPARLVAGGAAVDVPVTYSCTAQTMSVFVQVTEKVGNGIASGSAFTSVPCDGRTHRLLLRVTASHPGRAFTPGTATTQTDVSGCRRSSGDRYICGDDSVVHTIQLKG